MSTNTRFKDMKYFAQVGDKRFECAVETGNGSTFVLVDGKRYRVDLEHIAATDAYSVLVDGLSYEFALHDGGESIELTGAAGHFAVLVEDERTRAARAVAAAPEMQAGPHRVSSIMPGIVREVLVQPGQEVQKGTPLLILEAMKMQNEIRADRPGTVERVHVQPGTTVDKGAALVELT